LQPLPELQGMLFSEGFNVLLTAKDFVDKEFQPGFLCVALCGFSFGSSWLIRRYFNLNIKTLLILITEKCL
jgi:hypothetical protein